MKTKERTVGQCQLCGVAFKEQDLGDGVWYNYNGPDQYSYRGFLSCEECFEELQDRVDNKRERIMEDFNSRPSNFIPPTYPSGVENPLAEYHNNMEGIKRQNEIASNPNWEEENEYRKGILYTHKNKK